jgi:hypothetical protein
MTEQIETLMSLARKWVQARVSGNGGSPEQDALRQALEAALKPGEPVAFRTFDGEGGYDYRTFDENENYQAEWESANPNHKGWVDPLYTSAPPAQTPPKQEPRTGVWGYIDAQVARDMQGFYEAFGTATPPTQTPMHMSAPDERGYATFTTPPPRLTDEQIHDIYDQVAKQEPYSAAVTRRNVGRAIETAVRRQFGVTE